MKKTFHVLCLGTDSYLLHTRKLVLETEFLTETRPDIATAAAEWPTSPFHAIVLCHTCGPQELVAAEAYAATRTPPSHLVHVTALHDPPQTSARTVRNADGPRVLLTKLNQLIGDGHAPIA